jgi:hypothetical protein
MRSSIRNELNREKAKLDQLIEDAVNKGMPLGESEEILEQSRRVDELINKYQAQNRKRSEPSK